LGELDKTTHIHRFSFLAQPSHYFEIDVNPAITPLALSQNQNLPKHNKNKLNLTHL